MSRELPESPNLDHLKKQAKVLLRQLQRHYPGAKLAQAQHLVAREYGFASWAELKAHVESLPRSSAASPADATLRARDSAASHTGPQFGRYNREARQALFVSRYEAALHGSPRIEPEHVLLGLIHRHDEAARREDRDLPGRIFERSQLSVETVRNEVEASLQRSPVIRSREESAIGAPETHVPFSSDTERVLQYAAEEADRLRHSDIGTPHLLLGLRSVEDSVPTSILTEKGMRLDKVRDDVVYLLSEEPS